MQRQKVLIHDKSMLLQQELFLLEPLLYIGKKKTGTIGPSWLM